MVCGGCIGRLGGRDMHLEQLTRLTKSNEISWQAPQGEKEVAQLEWLDWSELPMELNELLQCSSHRNETTSADSRAHRSHGGPSVLEASVAVHVRAFSYIVFQLFNPARLI